MSDQFGRVHDYLRVSVTDRCNLRCTYCMPSSGVSLYNRSELLSLEEIVGAVRLLVEMGIRKVRFTGGEPLVRKGFTWLVEQISMIDGIEIIAMTTNAILLREHAEALHQAGMQRINISIDSLRHDRFQKITRFDALSTVLDGLSTAITTGFEMIKVNAVIQRGVNDDELLDFVEFVREKNIEVRFIEAMPFPGNQWTQEQFVSVDEMKHRIAQKYELLPLQSELGTVAESFTSPGLRGSIGFISPMSNHFCDRCNRLRLTANGNLKTCLFQTANLNLRDVMRNSSNVDEVKFAIREALQLKVQSHPTISDLLASSQSAMYNTGG